MSLTQRAFLIATLSAAAFREGEPGTSGSTAINQLPQQVIPDGMRAEKFTFRKEVAKDADGNVIGEVFKHPPVTIPLPIPSGEEIIAIFADVSRSSEQKFVLDQISDAFYLQAREQINDFREANKENRAARVSANIIDYSKLTINALANMPPSERSKISDDDMKAFLVDYISVMPEAMGKPADKIRAQANLLEKGLRPVRTDKTILGIMEGALNIWITATSAADDHQAVYEMLQGRIKRWTEATPKNLIDSIT